MRRKGLAGTRGADSIQFQEITCAVCEEVRGGLFRWGDRDETRENYRLLTSSGCVIQREDGEKMALPAEEALEAFGKMPPEHQALYL